MNASSSALVLEVLAAFPDAWTADRVAQFRKGVLSVVARVQNVIQDTQPSVELRPHFVPSSEATQCIGATCAVALLDAGQLELPIVLCVGRLEGADIHAILLAESTAERAVRELNLRNVSVLPYTSMDTLFQAEAPLQRELLHAVPQSRIHEELIYRFWFPRETSTIWVVCPQIHEPGEYAERTSPDYTYLDNLGDTDALLEVMVFLSQYYPNATIERFSAEDLPDGHTCSNLVVIGGPGSNEISNSVCREMMDAIQSRVSYSEDCERMTVVADGQRPFELQAQYRTNGGSATASTQQGLRKDWGYFARFTNPLNQNSTVILINGLHTAGVLGAARVLRERREALPNFHTVLASGIPATDFECYFEVPLVNRHVTVPVLNSSHVFGIGAVCHAHDKQHVIASQRELQGGRRTSARILFIVGDRGGSHVNQIQSPKEYHAIQDALHACKHRDAIDLANPILVATREKLAMAYRSRPSIIHFAGHGDERSLSIVEDYTVLANETPLDGEQLLDAIRTMEHRVRLCVLNACLSGDLAKRLVECDIVDSAVGWSIEVDDSAAISFSAALYGALGDGRTLHDAVDVARVASGAPKEALVLAAANGSTGPLIAEEGES